MEHEEAFLREIREKPEEIATRLIYADWLEEQGDPRGEFIRVQVELADSADVETTKALEARQAELLKTYSAHWVQPLKKIGIKLPVFRCGFVERVTLTASQFFKNEKHLPVLLPVVRILKIQDLLSVDVERFGESETLKTVYALELGGNDIRDKGLEGLIQSPNFNNLRSLGLPQTGVRGKGVIALTKASWFPRLDRLVLAENHLGNEGTKAIADSPDLRNLRELSLHRNDIGDVGGMALAGSPYLDNIRWLNLHHNQFTETVKNALRAKYGNWVWF